MGPNVLIWIAMAVVVVSTIAGLQGHSEPSLIGIGAGFGLAVLNKIWILGRGAGRVSNKNSSGIGRVFGYVAI